MEGNINPADVDPSGVPQVTERPLDLSDEEDSDEEDVAKDTELQALLAVHAAKPASDSVTSAGGRSGSTTAGVGGGTSGDKDNFVTLDSLWSNPPTAAVGPLTNKEKDQILKLKAENAGLQSELKKEKDENKRLVQERDKFKEKSANLGYRISGAHKASEEGIPWIQRDLQQALDLLKRQEEIALPAAHRHAALVERLDKQERYITKLLQLTAAQGRATTGGGGGGSGGGGGGGGGFQQQHQQEQQTQPRQLALMNVASTQGMADKWVEHFHDTHQRPFWVNHATQETTWERPANVVVNAAHANLVAGRGNVRRGSVDRTPSVHAAVVGGQQHDVHVVGEGAIIAGRLAGSAMKSEQPRRASLEDYEAQMRELERNETLPSP